MRPVLDQLNIVVRDMDATVAFYRSLGLDIPDDAVWRTPSGGHHLSIKMPGSGFDLSFDSVALAEVYNAGYREPGAGSRCVVSFRVPSREAVDEISGKLEAAGYEVLQPPYDAFWGARYAIIADPDGNHVGVMSASEEAHRRAPPSL